MDDYLTVQEVADRFRVNPQTVRNWIDRGELGAIRVGARRVRVLESELQRFVADGSSSATEDPPGDDLRSAILACAEMATLLAEALTVLAERVPKSPHDSPQTPG